MKRMLLLMLAMFTMGAVACLDIGPGEVPGVPDALETIVQVPDDIVKVDGLDTGPGEAIKETFDLVKVSNVVADVVKIDQATSDATFALNEYAEALMQRDLPGMLSRLSTAVLNKVPLEDPKWRTVFLEKERRKLIRTIVGEGNEFLGFDGVEYVRHQGLYVIYDNTPRQYPIFMFEQDGQYVVSQARLEGYKNDSYKIQGNYISIVDPEPQVQCSGLSWVSIGSYETRYLSCSDTGCGAWWTGSHFWFRNRGEADIGECDYNTWGTDVYVDRSSPAVGVCADDC